MSKEVMIVAEMGASHHQDFDTAVDIINAAALCGANAVKIQLFTPEQMTYDFTTPDFIIRDGLWKGFKLYDLYEAASLPLDWVPKLKKLAEGRELKFFATVYHPDMVDFAEETGIPIYKIAAFENNYLDLIQRVADTKKPVMISTGAAEYGEIKEAVNIIKKKHNKITLLHCISKYPAPIDEMHLKTIPALKTAFRVRAGISDHTDGIVAAVASVPLGAKVIEKHIRVDDIGLDTFAVLPERFGVMVETVRAAEKALGKVTYGGDKKFRRKKIEGKMVRTAG